MTESAKPGRPVVLLATPCFGGMVAHTYMLSVMALLRHAPEAGFEVRISMIAYDALISRARSLLVGACLDDPAVTHLLFVDADIGFEPRQVERLLRFDKQFCGAFYPLKSIDWDLIPQRCVGRGETLREAALSYVGTLCPEDGRRQEGEFATATYVGGGFQLIRRDALERMVAAYPHTRFSHVQSRPKSGKGGPLAGSNLYALFDSIIDPDSGAYLSEDYAFCRRWREIGGEIWLDTASRLTHFGPYEFVGDHAARFRPATPLG